MTILGNLRNWMASSKVDEYLAELCVDTGRLDSRGRALYQDIKNDKTLHLNPCETACFFFMIYLPRSPDVFTQVFGPTVWVGRISRLLRLWVKEGVMREEVAIQIALGVAKWGEDNKASD